MENVRLGRVQLVDIDATQAPNERERNEGEKKPGNLDVYAHRQCDPDRNRAPIPTRWPDKIVQLRIDTNQATSGSVSLANGTPWRIPPVLPQAPPPSGLSRAAPTYWQQGDRRVDGDGYVLLARVARRLRRRWARLFGSRHSVCKADRDDAIALILPAIPRRFPHYREYDTSDENAEATVKPVYRYVSGAFRNIANDVIRERFNAGIRRKSLPYSEFVDGRAHSWTEREPGDRGSSRIPPTAGLSEIERKLGGNGQEVRAEDTTDSPLCRVRTPCTAGNRTEDFIIGMLDARRGVRPLDVIGIDDLWLRVRNHHRGLLFSEMCIRWSEHWGKSASPSVFIAAKMRDGALQPGAVPTPQQVTWAMLASGIRVVMDLTTETEIEDVYAKAHLAVEVVLRRTKRAEHRRAKTIVADDAVDAVRVTYQGGGSGDLALPPSSLAAPIAPLDSVPGGAIGLSLLGRASSQAVLIANADIFFAEESGHEQMDHCAQ